MDKIGYIVIVGHLTCVVNKGSHNNKAAVLRQLLISFIVGLLRIVGHFVADIFNL